jgi:hypothetical protein
MFRVAREENKGEITMSCVLCESAPQVVKYHGIDFFYVADVLFYADETGKFQRFMNDSTRLDHFSQHGGIDFLMLQVNDTLEVRLRDGCIFRIQFNSNEWLVACDKVPEGLRPRPRGK